MKKASIIGLSLVSTIILVIAVFFILYKPASLSPEQKPRVVIETSLGQIEIELEPDKAPESVANFLRYTQEDFYRGTIFHRVIKNFMIQGGGFTAEYQRKNTRAPIKNEADNGLKNDRGSIAMARTNDPHSATSQFFINTVNNGFLNYKSQTVRGWGYTVFGKVTRGMDVVDLIQNVSTGPAAFFSSDAPQEAIIITDVRHLNPTVSKQ